MMPTFDAYRVGGGKRAKHWAHRWHVDRWFRSWQCEWEDALWCPRGWTKEGVLRKGRRWHRRNTDVKRHERRYGYNAKAREMRGMA
jgi:hypothetical protein